MAEKMNWKECIEKNIIVETTPDNERANQMLAMAMLRFEFWNQKIDEKFSALKIEAYYEIIKELIFALLYRQGYNCTNHLCLIAYLRQNTRNFDYETDKIDELRKVRNEITYRGFFAKKDYLKRNELEFKNIIHKLKEIIKNE